MPSIILCFGSIKLKDSTSTCGVVGFCIPGLDTLFVDCDTCTGTSLDMGLTCLYDCHMENIGKHDLPNTLLVGLHSMYGAGTNQHRSKTRGHSVPQ